MRIDEASKVPLTEILNVLGKKPIKKENNVVWYYSPLINDGLSLFCVDTKRNVWKDFGLRRFGSVIEFVMLYLEAQAEDCTRIDALRWLRNMLPGNLGTVEMTASVSSLLRKNIVVNKVLPIRDDAYSKYLSLKGIPLDLAKMYLKSAMVTNVVTNKRFSALAFENENGGFQLLNSDFKGYAAPDGISLVRGSIPLPKEVNVFKNVIDFLSMLASQNKSILDGDSIILNSLSNLTGAFPYIRGYSYQTLYSWLDNDSASQKAGEILNAFTYKQERRIVFKAMNRVYAGYKDVSRWHRSNISFVSIKEERK